MGANEAAGKDDRSFQTEGLAEQSLLRSGPAHPTTSFRQVASLGTGTHACGKHRPIYSRHQPLCLSLTAPLRKSRYLWESAQSRGDGTSPYSAHGKYKNLCSSLSCQLRVGFSLWTSRWRQIGRVGMGFPKSKLPGVERSRQVWDNPDTEQSFYTRNQVTSSLH